MINEYGAAGGTRIGGRGAKRTVSIAENAPLLLRITGFLDFVHRPEF
jgi:hypothetical protein